MTARAHRGVAAKDRAAAQTDPDPVPPDLEPDPFASPTGFTDLGDIRARCRVAVAGTVIDARCRRWDAGDTLEATLADPTGSLVLAFVGRRHVGGMAPGRRILASGTVVQRRGRLLVMNPYVWLVADDAARS